MPEISAREALLSRRSVRGFLAKPVPRAVLEDLLMLAGRAPSGTNIQPWNVYVASGDARQRITDEILAARAAGKDEHKDEYAYYPTQWRDPYLRRRRDLGKALYGHLGIPKEDKAGMARHFQRNYEFFGAPVGLFFAIDRDLEVGSWLDLGMFVQSVMIAARAHGLHTCPQQAFAQYHNIIRPIVGIPDEQVLVCGMSLGYEDADEPGNRLRVEREPVGNFVRFIG